MDLRERASTDGSRHPWETVRSAFFNRKIISLTDKRPVHILDIGSGDCWFSEQLIAKLPQGSQITCSDLNFTDDDIDTASMRGINKVRNIPQQSFDIVIMLDVLEHIEDDSTFLQLEVVPRLKPESHLVISVPAHPSLFTSHDTFLGHYRRYTRSQLLDVSGKFFSSNQNGYLFISLALVRLLQRITTSKNVDAESGIGNWGAGLMVTKLVNYALFIDAFVSRALQTIRVRIPGLTVWTICSSNQSVASK
jgi:ubiquinone/menaquinone biosynthesis C-methylase UbiE